MAGNRIKGITIEIEGNTTHLNNALNSTDKALRHTQSALNDVNRLLKFDPKNTELLAQKQKLLSQQITDTKSRLSQLKDAEKQVTEQFKKGEASQEQVDALKREIISTEQSLKSFEKQANSAEAQIKDVGTTGSAAMKQTEDSAGSAGRALDGMSSVAGAVGKSIAVSFLAATAAIVAATKALVDMTVGGASYADTVLTESTVTGIATDKLQEYMYAAELVDVSTETLTKSMAKQIKSMKSAQDGSKATAAAYATLGVSVTDANGELRDSDTVYWEIIDALGQMQNETERDAIAMQLLGKSAQELNPLIEAGSERMTELGEKARESGYVLSDDVLNSYGALDDQLQYLSVNAEAAKNSLGTILLPVLTELATSGNELLGEFTKSVADANGDIGKIGEAVGGMLSKIVQKLAEDLPEICEFSISLLGTLFQAIASSIGDALPVLIGAVSELLSMVVSSLPDVVGLAVDFINQLVENLPSIIQILCSALIDTAPALIDGIVSIICNLAANFEKITQPLIAALPDIIQSVVDSLISNLPMLIQGVITLTLGLVKATSQIVKTLTPMIPDIINQVVNALFDNAPLIMEGILQILLAVGELVLSNVAMYFELLGDLITECLPNLAVAIYDAIGECLDKIGELLSPLGDWIDKNVIQPIGEFFTDMWNGFTGGAASAWESVKGFFSGIPAWIEQNLIQPVGNFFSGLWNKITSTFSDIAVTVGDALSGAISSVVNAVLGVAVDIINGFIDGLNFCIGVLDAIGIGISPIDHISVPALAKGGIVTEETLARIGEGGKKEAILPLEQNTGWMDALVEKITKGFTNALATFQSPAIANFNIPAIPAYAMAPSQTQNTVSFGSINLNIAAPNVDNVEDLATLVADRINNDIISRLAVTQ